jgi:hypothetical protein
MNNIKNYKKITYQCQSKVVVWHIDEDIKHQVCPVCKKPIKQCMGYKQDKTS